MEPVIKSKLPHTGETIFTIMSSLAAAHKAINLGQGTPDFPVDVTLIGLVNKAMKDGHNQYAHKNGLLSLRETLTEKVFSLYHSAIDPGSEIAITPGGTYAVYTALTALLHPGDEVIIFEPAYDSYIPNVEANGATAVTISLSFPEYKIDWELVRRKITPATKAIILNSPHNPTGRILEEEDIMQLKKIVANTGIFIVSDEVYEHLVFDEKVHHSILKYPELFERSFVAFSFGKVFHCTGWKMGYCIAPRGLMAEFLKIHQYNCFCCNTPVQYALSSFLQQKESYLSLGSFFQKKRDLFQKLMAQTTLKALPTSGSYFQLYRFDNPDHKSENEMAKTFTTEAGVAAIPVSAFYKDKTDNSVLRFCFAKKDETLEEAVHRLLAYEKRFL